MRAPDRELVHWPDVMADAVYAETRARWPEITVHGLGVHGGLRDAPPDEMEFQTAAACLVAAFWRVARSDGVRPKGRGWVKLVAGGVRSDDLVSYVNRTASLACSHGAVLMAAAALGAPLTPSAPPGVCVVGVSRRGTATEGPRARRGGAVPRGDIPKRVRLMVYERDGYRCRHCGQSRAEIKARGDVLTVDHVVAVTAGGPTVLRNMQCLCGHCNRRKARRADAEMRPSDRRRAAIQSAIDDDARRRQLDTFHARP